MRTWVIEPALLPILHKQNTRDLFLEVAGSRSDGLNVLVRSLIDPKMDLLDKTRSAAILEEKRKQLFEYIQTYLEDACICRWDQDHDYCPIHHVCRRSVRDIS